MGYIDAAGEYHTGDPPMATLVQDRTTVWKQSDHDRQRQEYKADLVRPFLPSGEPNPEFIELYPDESKYTYHFIPTDEEIAREQ